MYGRGFNVGHDAEEERAKLASDKRVEDIKDLEDQHAKYYSKLAADFAVYVAALKNIHKRSIALEYLSQTKTEQQKKPFNSANKQFFDDLNRRIEAHEISIHSSIKVLEDMTDNHALQDLIKLILECEAHIEKLKKVAQIKLENEKNKRIVDVTLDAPSFVVSEVNNVGRILGDLADGVNAFSKVIAPLQVFLIGFSSIWDSIKTIRDKTEKDWPKAVKIVVNVTIVALAIAACIAAPWIAVGLIIGVICLGAYKDGYVPWKKAKEELAKKEHELANVRAEITADKSTHSDSPTLTALVEREIKLTAQVNMLREKEWEKRKELTTSMVGLFGFILCVIPFPPIQILGAAILLATAVVSLVQKYKLVTKVKEYFNPPKDKNKDANKPHPDVANEKMPTLTSLIHTSEMVRRNPTLTGMIGSTGRLMNTTFKSSLTTLTPSVVINSEPSVSSSASSKHEFSLSSKHAEEKSQSRSDQEESSPDTGNEPSVSKNNHNHST